MLISERKAIYALAFLMLISCSESNRSAPAGSIDDDFIRGADLSFLPMLEQEGTIFFNDASGEMDALSIFKDQGLNAVRIRLWYRPEDEHSSFDEVKLFAEQVHSEGLLVWLTVHYSDSWADPEKQVTPADWQEIPFDALIDSVYNYTSRIVEGIKPDIIQIGNEINPGLLFPYGKIAIQEDQLILPEFPASFEGQKEFLLKLREISTVAGCIGICYWAPEWVAFDGQQSQDGSPWENMALFDFSNKLLPGAKVFGVQ